MKGLIFLSFLFSFSLIAKDPMIKKSMKSKEVKNTQEKMVNNKKLFELEHIKAKGQAPIYHKVEERKTKERQP
ncbi:MAG: hypothetical protein ACOVP4_02570 [Bacteriovoracaceae bacterium]